jgi:lipopolysaccharide transport system permease protein
MDTTKHLTHVNDPDDQWDLEIKPHTSLFRLNYGEVWKYRDLVWLFVRRDFVAQYKQTILGPLWHVIQPLFTTAMFVLIFSRIANIPTDGINPILFYMAGITIWNYFSTCLLSTSSTFVSNASIFGKVYFPRLVIPLSIVLSNILKFAIQFALLLILIVWYQFHGYHIHITWSWFLIPVLLAIMALMSLGLGIIISSYTTKYRDLSVLLQFAIQLAMYATPIAYPLSYLQGKSYSWLININPLTPVVEGFKYIIFGRGTITAPSIAYSICFTIAVLLLGSMIFNRAEKTFMDTV